MLPPDLRSAGNAIVALAVVCSLGACTPSAPPPLAGYVEGEFVRVAAPFAGTLQQLSVRRGDEVVAGAPLFALERENETAERREALARLAAADARLANLQTGKRPDEVNSVAEQLRKASAARDLSAANLRRQEQLYASGFVSKAIIEDARIALQRDEAEVAQFRAQVAMVKLPARVEEIRTAEAEVKAAREVLAQSEWKLAQRAVTVPVTGRVHDTYYVLGDWVPAGGVVASLLPPANVKVRFYLPQSKLSGVRAGQPVRLGCDGCAAPIPAVIDYISDRAEFTPPVLYAKDSRGDLVFLVEARPKEPTTILKPGQPVDILLEP